MQHGQSPTFIQQNSPDGNGDERSRIATAHGPIVSPARSRGFGAASRLEPGTTLVPDSSSNLVSRCYSPGPSSYRADT